MTSWDDPTSRASRSHRATSDSAVKADARATYTKDTTAEDRSHGYHSSEMRQAKSAW